MRCCLPLLLGLLIAMTCRTASAADRPNVLFIICDDLNTDLGCYGHPDVKSPNIDALAARGRLFERAYCNYPQCGASRASLMTGLYPGQTSIYRNAIRIRERMPDVKTITQHFMQHGYEAVRIGKIYHYNVPSDIGTDGHDDPGSWSKTFNPTGRDKTDEAKVFTLRPAKNGRRASYGGTLSWLIADGEDEEQTDGIAATEAVRQLEGFAKSKQPFFLAVGFYRPHTPYVAPKKYFDMYPLEEIEVPTVPEGYLETLPKSARTTLTRKKEQVDLDPKLARQAIQAYRASITFVDAQIGRVLDALKTTGLEDDTIVVFTSDHGYHMGEHGFYQKMTLFENADRVPLIIATPNQPQPGVATGHFAELVDFYPTVTEFAGLSMPKHLSGRSLLPTVNDPDVPVRDSALTVIAKNGKPGAPAGYTLRTSRYRFSKWLDEATPETAMQRPMTGYELYDHQTDSYELNNLAYGSDAIDPDTLKRLRTRLEQRIAESIVPKPGITLTVPKRTRQR